MSSSSESMAGSSFTPGLRRLRRRDLLSLGMLVLVSLHASAASACSPPLSCTGAGIFPATDAIPANASAVEWWTVAFVASTVNPTLARLERYDDDAMRWLGVAHDADTSVPGRVTLRPRSAFAVGERYRLGTGMQCPLDTGTPWKEFRVTEAAPLPATLGALQATIPALDLIPHGPFVAGECAARAFAMVTSVSVNLGDEARAWSSMLTYEAFVDGQRFVGMVESGFPSVPPPAGATHHGRGRARLAVLCAPAFAGAPWYRDAGIPEGDHTVVMRARIAGTEAVLETAPLRVELRCPGAPGIDGGAPSLDAATPAVVDAPRADLDTGSTPAPSRLDAATGDAARDPPGADGGCAAARPRRGDVTALLLAMGALFARVRRRASSQIARCGRGAFVSRRRAQRSPASSLPAPPGGLATGLASVATGSGGATAGGGAVTAWRDAYATTSTPSNSRES